jgi:acetoin utilization protein AcuC
MDAGPQRQASVTQRSNGGRRTRSPAIFVASDFCRRPGFGRHHPLSIPRVATVLELCERLGWLDAASYRDARAASVEQLTAYHHPDYVEALRSSDLANRVEPGIRERYGFGTLENPLFPGVFERAATAVGGSILAAELALEGRTVFHPAGGTHHGRRDRASGFCYFNDPVFAILTLLARGVEGVLYVDLDAHHGDGVQEAFLDDARVRVISIHESDRWPHTGAADDRGHGHARNLPVPAGFNDDELDFLLDGVVLPLGRDFAPQAVVVTCGTDALAGDPLSRLGLSNVALWRAVERVVDLAAVAVVLGGGGYNPWTLARCWSGLWARLAGHEIPMVLPADAQVVLRGLSCDLVDDEDVQAEWLTTVEDRPRRGPVREAVRNLAEAQRRLHALA